MAGVFAGKRLERHGPGAKWLLVVLLGTVVVCLLVEAGFGLSETGGPASRGRSEDLFAVAGQITSDTYGLYLLDRKNGTICVYQWLSGTRKLRLLAARNYTFDLQLDEYNTEPLPRDIKKLVEQHRRLGETTPQE